MLEKIRNASSLAWVRFVQALNGLAATAGVVIAAVYAMYPDAVKEFAETLSPALKIVVLGAWAVLVHLSLRQAVKKGDDQ